LTISLTDYLERSAARFPDKTAFTDENGSVTFAELRIRARAFGTAVARRTGRTRLPVAVLSRHTVSDVAAFFGILYAGCFYVPLDGDSPAEHQETRLAALRPALTVDGGMFAELSGGTPDDALLEEISSRALGVDPAYAIFTSGSTGEPKAALISHAAVIELTEWLCGEFGFDANTVFANQSPFYFDASVVDTYCAVKLGGTSHIVPKKMFISPLKVMRYLGERDVNTIMWATAAVKLMANSGVFSKYVPPELKTVMFGGENMTGRHLNIWRAALPEARFVNLYGPTETTVCCSYYEVVREFGDGESIPVGRACRGTELMLLDGSDKPAADGESGEIVVRGARVGLGYYGRPDATERSFVQNPLNTHYRDVVYRTGDIARLNGRGELVYIGRADNQIKHMGARVELGELEAAADALEGVELSAAAYDRDRERIVLFYQGAAEQDGVSRALSGRLPRYMCPNAIIRADKMPELPNGKIDRLRLMREFYDQDR
jgi:amino acid adenylation domain-containing protein